MPSLSEIEERALKMVREAGEALQCDLWKALNVSSREGSRITLRLERKGCPDIERCAPGQPISPGTCPALTRWLEAEARGLESGGDV